MQETLTKQVEQHI